MKEEAMLKKVGAKEKNVGDNLKNVGDFSKNLPRFLSYLPRFYRQTVAEKRKRVKVVKAKSAKSLMGARIHAREKEHFG